MISFIALVVALSATAYAATRITKSSQIKNGIVTSADIKNKTIGTIDLSKSTLKRIDGGSASTSTTASEGVRKVGPLNQPANQVITVASMSIPAGSYVISAKTTLAAQTKAIDLLEPFLAAATATCRLDAAGDEDQSEVLILIGGRQTPTTTYMQTVRTVGGTAAIVLKCSSVTPWSAANTSIIAQRVSGTDKKELAG